MKANTKNPRRRIVVYIAVSADGYIARADGSVDWLDRPRPPGDYGFSAFLRSIDAIVLGRKTYDQALQMTGGKGLGFAKIKHYVFSHRPPEPPAPGVEFVNEPVDAFAQRLRSQSGPAHRGKDIWMMGGAALIASFLDAGAIDAFSIHVIPVLIGEGIRLLEARDRLVPLKLRSVRRFPDGVVHLGYDVPRRAEYQGNDAA